MLYVICGLFIEKERYIYFYFNIFFWARRHVSKAANRNQTPPHKNPTAAFHGFVYPLMFMIRVFYRGKGSNVRSAVRYHLYQSTMRSSLIPSIYSSDESAPRFSRLVRIRTAAELASEGRKASWRILSQEKPESSAWGYTGDAAWTLDLWSWNLEEIYGIMSLRKIDMISKWYNIIMIRNSGNFQAWKKIA